MEVSEVSVIKDYRWVYLVLKGDEMAIRVPLDAQNATSLAGDLAWNAALLERID